MFLARLSSPLDIRHRKNSTVDQPYQRHIPHAVSYEDACAEKVSMHPSDRVSENRGRLPPNGMTWADVEQLERFE